ncbi:hypothetical protein [Microvirga sp. TS319]|uniref:hypothetical protein n=1 Tax=Microvirga sp. TS319 TaxID=3241165 RepID=UPI00351A1BD3
MPPRKSSNVKPCLIACATLLPVLALSACADYVKRSDTVTASAGDALAFDKVVHIDDPWPPNSGNTRLTANSQRVDKATKRYLGGGSGGGPSGASITLAPQAPAPDQTASRSGQ